MRKDLIRDIFEETRNTLNTFAIAQLKASGKEIQKHGTKKMQGASIVNPILKLYTLDTLTKQQKNSAIFFQKEYAIASSAGYKRDILEARTISNKNNYCLTSDRAIDAKNYIDDVIKDVRSLKMLGALEILNDIFLHEMSINNFKKKYVYLKHNRIIATIKKICDIL
jgi:hypothetical protein